MAWKSVSKTRSAGLVRDLRLFVALTRRVRSDEDRRSLTSAAYGSSLTGAQRKVALWTDPDQAGDNYPNACYNFDSLEVCRLFPLPPKTGQAASRF